MKQHHQQNSEPSSSSQPHDTDNDDDDKEANSSSMGHAQDMPLTPPVTLDHARDVFDAGEPWPDDDSKRPSATSHRTV
jgi:hypothetical protein